MQKDNATWGDHKRRRGHARPPRQQHDLLCLSHVVGHELLWLPPLDGSKPQDAQSSQRRRRFAKLYLVQFPGDSRRHLYARQGRHGHRPQVAPVRSSSAVLVSSRNQNREWIYAQQQTVSAEGFRDRHSTRTCRTRFAAARRKNVPIVTCPRKRTTTRGSHRCICRELIS